jgi:hypothetical protein
MIKCEYNTNRRIKPKMEATNTTILRCFTVKTEKLGTRIIERNLVLQMLKDITVPVNRI